MLRHMSGVIGALKASLLALSRPHSEHLFSAQSRAAMAYGGEWCSCM